MRDTVIIHTDEISLKGGNRRFFERLLLEDIRRKLAGIATFRIHVKKGTVLLRHDGPIPEAAVPEIADALTRVFGVAYAVFARAVERDMAAISAAGVDLMTKHEGTQFRVTARRADKTFPLTSMDIARELGGDVLTAVPGTSVDLHSPEHVLRVEVEKDRAYVALDRHAGPGGLPAGSTGTVAALLSGGIDSPVAAWKLMRRGANLVLVHFHSYPFVGAESIEKVKRLATSLAAWQPGITLHLVPFGELQREITARTDERMRVVLYRRFMFRIAERIASAADAKALVTGEALGQVASQTLENMTTVDAAARMPVLRPLVGDDKRDIIAAARRIGTYDISIEPHDDCCTLFVPSHPELRSTERGAEREEALLDVDALVADALDRTETVQVTRATEGARVTAR